MRTISETPRNGVGKPVRCRYFGEEVWSQRINNADRLIYTIYEETKVIGVNKPIIITALNSEMKDFVDAIQTETAFYNGIGTIITRDKKDYVNIGIQVFNPLEYINDMSKIE